MRGDASPLHEAMPDASLVGRARGGDRPALELLLRRHLDRIAALCRRLCGPDADDAVQDALIAMVRGLPRFDGRAAFSTWAYRVATNACLDELRRRARRPVADDETVVAAATDADVADAVASRLDVDAALARLGPDHRSAVVLRDLCDLDYAEIATVLDLPIGTVRSRIARGRARLADIVAGNPDGAAHLERPAHDRPPRRRGPERRARRRGRTAGGVARPRLRRLRRPPGQPAHGRPPRPGPTATGAGSPLGDRHRHRPGAGERTSARAGDPPPRPYVAAVVATRPGAGRRRRGGGRPVRPGGGVAARAGEPGGTTTALDDEGGRESLDQPETGPPPIETSDLGAIGPSTDLDELVTSALGRDQGSPAAGAAGGPGAQGAAVVDLGCEAAARAGESALGSLRYAATATWEGRPAIVYAFDAASGDVLALRVLATDGCAPLATTVASAP